MEWMLIYLNNLCECNILTRFIWLLRKYSSFPGCQKQQLWGFFFLFLLFFSPFGNSSKIKYQKFGFSSHQNAVNYLSLLSQLCLFPTRSQEVFLPIFQLSGKLSVTDGLVNWIWVPQCFISFWSFTSSREQHCCALFRVYHPNCCCWDSWSMAVDQLMPMRASAAWLPTNSKPLINATDITYSSVGCYWLVLSLSDLAINHHDSLFCVSGTCKLLYSCIFILFCIVVVSFLNKIYHERIDILLWIFMDLS